MQRTRLFPLFPLAFVLAGLLLASPVLLAQEGPTAVPVEPIQDFGVVAKGEVVTHDFQIRNAGDETLLVEDVRPACGCTVARYDKQIAPGEVGTVHAEVDTTDFYGPISKSIAVYTNDDENPKLQLVVKAKVTAYVSATPGYARFLYVQMEPFKPITQIVWGEDQPLEVVDVRTRSGDTDAPSDKIRAEFRPAKESEKVEEGKDPQWAVDIFLDPRAEVGTLREFVIVETNHPKQKTAKIPVSGFVRPRQHVTPMEADFGKVQGDALPLRRTFHFTSFITEEIEVEKIETGYEGMEASMEANERRPGHRFEMMLELGPEMPKGKFETVIEIHTTDKVKPVVEVPVKGEVI